MNSFPKDWYTSKTIWASLVASVWPILMLIEQVFGFTITASQGTVVDDIMAAVTLISTAIAIYGRVVASAPIAKPSTPKVNGFVIAAILLSTMSLSACTNATVVTADSVYTVAAALTETETGIAIYAKSPNADPAALAKLRSLDATAYGIVHPLVDEAAAGQSVVTAVQVAAAQAALTELANYLASLS